MAGRKKKLAGEGNESRALPQEAQQPKGRPGGLAREGYLQGAGHRPKG